jgi:hypothetical protein
MSAANNDDDPDGRPTESPPATPPSRPPLLDYPSAPSPDDLGTERWSEVGRAMAIVFGFLILLFVIGFGLCGVVLRGC